MTIKQNKNKGFSLVEVIIYIAIFTTFVLMSTDFVMNLLKVTSRQEIVSNTSNNMRYIIGKIVNNVRYANDINETESVFNSNNGILVIDTESDEWRYYLDGGMLYEKKGSNTAQALSDSSVTIDKFYITPAADPILSSEKDSISISIDIINENKTDTFDFSVSLRNNL